MAMSKKEELIFLIETYETFAARHDATADELVATANRQGWHDDLTQQIDGFRHQAATNQMLAHEVRDGMAE